jgi:serine protease Do
VIGINARAIFFGENLGFAIPINTAKVVIEQILEYGEVERSWIGIEWQEIKEYRYYKNDLRLEGVLIAYIEEGSPAEQAGLKAGDLVYQINDQPVNAIYREELPKVRKLIAEIPVNSSIQITYMRDDKKQESIFRTELRGKFEGTEFECTGWDLSVKELTPRIIKNLNLKEKEGVLVSGVRLGGLAHEAEVFRGSVITHIDTHKIKNLEHFKDLFTRMEKLPPQGRMLQLIYRSATTFALLKEK